MRKFVCLLSHGLSLHHPLIFITEPQKEHRSTANVVYDRPQTLPPNLADAHPYVCVASYGSRQLTQPSPTTETCIAYSSHPPLQFATEPNMAYGSSRPPPQPATEHCDSCQPLSPQYVMDSYITHPHLPHAPKAEPVSHTPPINL